MPKTRHWTSPRNTPMGLPLDSMARMRPHSRSRKLDGRIPTGRHDGKKLVGMASYVEDTELRLGLPGSDALATRGSKRSLPEDDAAGDDSSCRNGGSGSAAKAQVVGWPPIRTYRKNSFQAMKVESEASGLFVKVSMDGAPYLRKIDLKVYKGYKELREGLDGMFNCFSQGDLSRKEACNGSEFAITYEDKDGDLMLVGDVPWEMFICSCKRLRIMKGSEARVLLKRKLETASLSLEHLLKHKRC
ncbi:hypothetical protein ZIOFF_031397 [Zingiber officinale]|uniref:Auxin-responsive protein n=1 Tax=Zingiber officinale TaxID=94328 RepID=A0A8J5GGI9_ZINOF|nr:hypothetical protein ZIOFF_031397 [Zingiber officinale]